MNISIVVFCYNEHGSIAEVLRSCREIMESITHSYEMIIVDDGSTDGTSAIIESFAANTQGVRHIRHENNKGIGMALRTGYECSTLEYVCAIPGDGQFDINELRQVKPFTSAQFYSFYRTVTNYNLYRKFLNVANRVFNRFFLGIKLHDVNWIKVYRKEQLIFVDAALKSSIIESEICAKLIKAGCSPIEIPSVYHLRLTGQPKGGNLKTLFKAISEMFSLVTELWRFNKML